MMPHAWNPSTLEVEAEKSGIQDQPQIHVEFEANQAGVSPDLGKKWSKMAGGKTEGVLCSDQFLLCTLSSCHSHPLRHLYVNYIYMHKYIYMHIYNSMIFVFIYISKSSSSFLNYNQNLVCSRLILPKKKCLTDVIFEN